MANPLKELTVTQGWKKNPGTYDEWYDESGKLNTSHMGVDYRARTPLPVFAVSDGTVVESKANGGWGENVRHQDKHGKFTISAHLSRRDVSVGQHVKAGQQIGLTGNTGNSKAPHLHFSVYTVVNGQIRYEDPIAYINLNNKQLVMDEEAKKAFDDLNKRITDTQNHLQVIENLLLTEEGKAALAKVLNMMTNTNGDNRLKVTGNGVDAIKQHFNIA